MEVFILMYRVLLDPVMSFACSYGEQNILLAYYVYCSALKHIFIHGMHVLYSQSCVDKLHSYQGSTDGLGYNRLFTSVHRTSYIDNLCVLGEFFPLMIVYVRPEVNTHPHIILGAINRHFLDVKSG